MARVFLESGLKLKEIAFNENDSSHKEGEILELSKDYAVIALRVVQKNNYSSPIKKL